jgi:hypothetical protein
MTATSRMGATTTVELRDLRTAGAMMLGAALLLPVLPGPDGIPCPLRTLTGVPCPLCGMTTSVTAAMHLHPVEAIAANPAGVLAVLVAVALLALYRRRTVDVPVWVLPVALVAMELWELVRFGII